MDQVPRLDQFVDLVTSAEPVSPLDQLAAAVRVAEELGELADHLVGHFVDAARRSGASWAEIGQSLGVSKQAVQKRFVANVSGDLDDVGTGRYARFTARAKSVVTHARDRARETGAETVLPLHVLLGLLHERGALAAQAIVAAGASLDDVRTRVDAALPSRAARTDAAHLTFSTGSKQLLERTLREALLLGHNYIGTEHMLLAMLGDPAEDAGRILHDLGVERDPTREWLVAKLTR
ncbi:MAG: ATP-dependent Clp protease ATP-binding subunit [Actinobacteria bacterium]|nr:ATP-dependent Clp protease ATP-binding subunit [Actinomycetota bacterium]